MRVLAMVLLVVVSAARADDAGPLASGFALLDEAVRLRVSDPGRSAQLAGDAAVLIRSGLPGDGLDNAPAQRALGNAWLLSGDLGRAVLAYRRAEAAAPGDPLVRSSLGHARSLVDVEYAERNAAGGLDRWRARAPRGVVFWACLCLFVAGCWVLALRVLSVVSGRLTGVAVVAVLAGVLGLGALAVEPMLSGSGWAVVVRGEVGRTGPHAEIYPPALDRPVPSGAEVRVLEEREGWVLCSLGGQRAWLPAGSVERVRPSRADQTPGGV